MWAVCSFLYLFFPSPFLLKCLLVAPKKFLSLPLGATKASGWLHDQVQTFPLSRELRSSMCPQLLVQANGLAGNEHDFYH